MNGINTHKPSWDIKIWLPLLLAVAYGIFARLYNLGHWELTIDEYYIVKSIESILDNGLPSFGCGGYYERGLLQQYLTAPLIAYCDNTAFAARILPALANILAFPVMFKLAEKVSQSRLIASIVTGLFALSLWEIEFARFARMYSFFQLVFILQLYWLVEIIIEDRIDRYKYLLATTALGIFIYQGVIFSLILCTLPIILRTNHIKPSHLIGFCATTLLIAIRTKIHFRSLFSEPRYPVEYVRSSGGKLPIYTPDFMLGDLTLAWVAGACVALGLILVMLFRSRNGLPRNTPWQNGVLVCTLVCALTHQFTLALTLVLIAACFGLFKDRAKHFLSLCLLIVIPFAIFWLLFGTIQLDQNILATVKLLAKYPSIYWYVLGPFIASIPQETAILLPVVLIGGIFLVREVITTGKISAASLLLGVCIMLVVAQGALVTPEKSTRYTFFLYPGLLVLFCYLCFTLPGKLGIKTRYQQYASAGIIVLMLMASENYNPRHLFQVSSAEYNFRMPYDRYLQFHFYQRYSFVDAADFVNNNLKQGDQVIVTTPGIDYYLDQVDYTYREISTSRFKETSACSGTKYIWNDTPLIYTEEDLIKQIANGAHTTWIVTGENNKGWSPEDQFISSFYEKNRVFTGLDSQVRVYKIAAHGN